MRHLHRSFQLLSLLIVMATCDFSQQCSWRRHFNVICRSPLRGEAGLVWCRRPSQPSLDVTASLQLQRPPPGHRLFHSSYVNVSKLSSRRNMSHERLYACKIIMSTCLSKQTWDGAPSSGEAPSLNIKARWHQRQQLDVFVALRRQNIKNPKRFIWI